MPAATTPPAVKTEKEEQLWVALKRHIIRERQRKKQELEAEVEEERLRKEREAREKQDVMTLGETRDQIQMLDKKLQELRNEKQQLFLQLKKVLNEDDNRKRQLHKESVEMFAIHNMAPQQIFMPQRGVPHQQHLLHKGNPQVNVAKRTRSPSSPQPMPGYYKQPNNSQSYQQPQKIEDGRRGGEVARAVLWNKQPQYCTPGTLFYPTSNQSNSQDNRPQPIIYPNYQGNINMPIRQNQYHVDMTQQPPSQSKPEMVNKNTQPQGNVYHINLDQPGMQQQSNQGPPPPQMKSHSQGQPITIEKIQERGAYHIDMKLDDRKDSRAVQQQQQQQQQAPPPHMPENIVYTSALRAGQIPIHAIAANQQIPKSGSITQGYPSTRPSNPQPPPSQLHYRHRY